MQFLQCLFDLCGFIVQYWLKSKISLPQHIQNMNQTLMVKALLVFTCSCNVFCSQSHEEYASHAEADLCRLTQIECHSASRGKPPHGSHPTQTNCWQLEKGNTCNNDNPKTITPPRKGNTTHSTMTNPKIVPPSLKHRLRSNVICTPCNNDHQKTIILPKS